MYIKSLCFINGNFTSLSVNLGVGVQVIFTERALSVSMRLLEKQGNEDAKNPPLSSVFV